MKLECIPLPLLRSICGASFKIMHLLEASGSSGSLPIAWDQSDFEGFSKNTGRFSITMEFISHYGHYKFAIINVYGLDDTHSYLHFFNRFFSIRLLCTIPWAMMGD